MSSLATSFNNFFYILSFDDLRIVKKELNSTLKINQTRSLHWSVKPFLTPKPTKIEGSEMDFDLLINKLEIIV